MKKLLNTLYVTSSDNYLSLDGENIVIKKEEQEVIRLPLHNVESIVTFGYTGASPALMKACAAQNIALCFLSPNGRFQARIVGEVHGNVLLRKKQYRVSDDEQASLGIAKNMIIGKLYNSRWVIERATRDHALRVDVDKLKRASELIKNSTKMVSDCQSLEQLRGVEGESAIRYFGVMDDLILQQKEDFKFVNRSRRPPMDKVNAMLSFAYTLLANDVSSALEGVGLDPYVGFLHRDRPGRVSLALDLMEEMRPVLADRFILTLINKREVNGKGFTVKENGAVIMDDATRKAFLNAWQSRKQETLTHPYLDEKIHWGLLPHVQAMLLARHLRGDLEAYPPFLWK